MRGITMLREVLVLPVLVVSALFSEGTSVLAENSSSIEKVDVFVAGKDGYNTYRIPPAVRGPDGSLLAICEGRKNNRDDHGDIDLVMKRSSDGGKSWGPLQVLYEEGGHRRITIGNPCPVVDS